MISVIIGTHAEFIKMFPVLLEIEKLRGDFDIVLTGQNDIQKSELFGLVGLGRHVVDCSVSCVRPTSALKMMFWSLLSMLKTCAYLLKKRRVRPRSHGDADLVCVVHGDTVSCLVGALSARIAGWDVFHVEAGLRSGSLVSPFPEEIVRRVVDRLSKVWFCPQVLESVRSTSSKLVIDTGGNTLMDSGRFVRALNKRHKFFNFSEQFYMFVLHRQENLVSLDFFWSVISAIEGYRDRGLRCVLIEHQILKDKLRQDDYRKLSELGILVLPRLDYLDFQGLLDETKFILTDGGSNQEECAYLGIPCAVLREFTERQDGIGKNVTMVGRDTRAISHFMDNYLKYRRPEINLASSPSQIVAKAIAESIEN